MKNSSENVWQKKTETRERGGRVRSVWKPRTLLFHAALLATFVLSTQCFKAPPRDYLIVVDTSGSMSGKSKTFGKVKESIPRLMEAVSVGDTVTLITFDQEVRVGETFHINSEEDKQKPTDYINKQHAWGLFTDMGAMLNVVRSKAAELEKKGRQSYIVILSDGMDDPPPVHRNGKIDLKKLETPEEEKLPVEDYFIYYVSLGSFKDPVLEKKLNKMSGQVRVIDASGKRTTLDGASSAEQVGLEEVTQDIEGKTFWENFKWIALILGAVLLGLLLIFLVVYLIYSFSNRHKLAGQLRYYEEGISGLNPDVYSVDKLRRSSMQVGPRIGSDLKIKDLGIPQPVSFKSKKIGNDYYLKPVGKSSSLLHFLSQKRKGLISHGDKFKLGNYIFEYRHGQDDK